MPKIEHFWAKTRRVYRYRLSCTGTGMQWATCTGTGQGCTGTSMQQETCTDTGQGCTGRGCSSSPVLICFHFVKSRIRIPMSRDPKKRLMGVQLRLELGEKCTVPRYQGEANSSSGRLGVLTQDF